jgi:hypothetical protein
MLLVCGIGENLQQVPVPISSPAILAWGRPLAARADRVAHGGEAVGSVSRYIAPELLRRERPTAGCDQ